MNGFTPDHAQLIEHEASIERQIVRLDHARPFRVFAGDELTEVLGAQELWRESHFHEFGF